MLMGRFTEHQPELLRALRHETGSVTIEGRGDVLDGVYGEVHGDVEYD